MEESKFNFNCARVFLTYPHFDTTPKDFFDRIKPRLENYGLHKYVVGRETHSDGTPHIHAVFSFATKLHTRDARFFDIGDRHPNIRKVDNPEKVASYCRKEGNYIEDWPKDIRGYRSITADQDASDRDRRYKSLLDPIPFLLPVGGMYTKDMAEDKKRHHWFVSLPDWGKTKWVETTFAGTKVYKRVESNYPFDDYRDQAVIIYDDYEPSLVELLNVSNTYGTDTPVYGATRYCKRYWGIGDKRVMIVLSNQYPEYKDNASFKARFTISWLSGSLQPQNPPPSAGAPNGDPNPNPQPLG